MHTLSSRSSLLTPIANLPDLQVEDLRLLPTLESAVVQVAMVYDFQRHPYLLWMQTAASQTEFLQSQLPFRFAVESFSQALAAVLARVPHLETRLPLADNIAEEHGRGDRLRTHKATFQQYLWALGATSIDLETPCTVPVLAFNQAILTYCLSQPAEMGAAMLGTIEYLYVGISATIARTLIQQQWTTPGSQSHYAQHEYLDTEHARDLLKLAEPAWSQPYCRTQVAQAVLLGAYYFWSLYRDLQPNL